MKKLKKCPDCNSTDLGDRWSSGRMLQQHCECGWKGNPRVPERRKVSNLKYCHLDEFSGWDYIVYDRYGYPITYSETFSNRATALRELKEELIQSEFNRDFGPCTGVLFKTPDRIKIAGEVFTAKGRGNIL